MRARVLLVLTLIAGLAAMASAQTKPAPKPAPKPAAPAAPAGHTPGAGPVIVVETVKGTFEFETYPNEAPRTVEHIVNLVKKNFYNGLRFHRVEPGFVIQAGDPNTRDYMKKDIWGTGGSGTPVGVSELSRKHKHVTGAVAMAHPGNPAKADAQFYVMLGPRPSLDGKYVVFGQVISGFDVPAKIRVGDVIKRMYVKP
jgi:peptidyl-prolyl cis-trans isomerase B (cyclophilin B)